MNKKLQNKKNFKETREEIKNLRLSAIPNHVVQDSYKTLYSETKNLIGKNYLELLAVNTIYTLLMIVSLIPVLGWFFVYGSLRYGYDYYFIKLIKGEDRSIKDMFYGFSKKNYIKCMLVSMKLWGRNILWALLLIVPAFAVQYNYCYVFYAMVEEENLSPIDAISRSRAIMNRNKQPFFEKSWIYFALFILSIPTAFILWFFVGVYYFAYRAVFYKKIQDNINKVSINSENILEIKNLKKYFPYDFDFFGLPKRFVKAVDDVSLSIPYGHTLGIVGESGCGKTTLGRTLLGLTELTSGSVFFAGKNIGLLQGSERTKLRLDMQIIFQDPFSSLSPRMPIGEIIAEGVRFHNIVKKEDVRGYVVDVMKKCGLQEFYYDRYPHEFSGGQRQRICIARALAVNPKFIVCDEPVSALDVSIQAQIINLLKSLQKDMNLTYMFISHDLSVVEHISDSIGVMYLGSLVEIGATDNIFKNPLHPYTEALFSAVPIPDPEVKMNRIILKGDIPSPSNPPSGCKFHTRCSKCMDICTKVKPTLIEIEKGHSVACHLYDKK